MLSDAEVIVGTAAWLNSLREWLAEEIALTAGEAVTLNRQGVVVVHEDLARPALLAQRTLQAADIAHGEALQAMLAKVRLPRIVVPAFAQDAARAA